MNVKSMRDQLIETYEKLQKGEISINEAKELANVSGKVLASAKTQLEYNKFLGYKDRKIEFLESNE